MQINIDTESLISSYKIQEQMAANNITGNYTWANMHYQNTTFSLQE
jgi:hypothetical protein